MIFTVAIVIVNGEAFVDPRLDTLTPVVRDILRRTAHDRDSFEILTVNIVPRIREEIGDVVRNLIERNSVDLILVVGGIGFDDNDCTPEASTQIYEWTDFMGGYLGACIVNLRQSIHSYNAKLSPYRTVSLQMYKTPF